MLYPIKFDPVYKQILWGGNKIQGFFKRNVPYNNIAESWELCCREDGMSTICNGSLKGLSLQELASEYKGAVIGKRVYESFGLHFPLLIKIIDANDKLSVQVHPNDEYAVQIGEKNGKNEMWYIIDAKENARLIYGLKEGITKEAFTNAISQGKISDTLNEVYVKPGDCIYIPAGTVHAILDGILIAEIQQNSNTTFRLYDWDRCDSNGNRRELHIDKALDVIHFNQNTELNRNFQVVYNNKSSIKKLLHSEFFNIDEITINGEYSSHTSGDSFISLLNIWGSGKILYSDGEESIYPGDTILLPASMGSYIIEGNLKMLAAYIY